MYKNLLLALLIIVLLLFIFDGAKQAPKVITTIDTLWRDTTITKWRKGKDIPFKVLDTFYIDSSNKVSHDSLKICDKIRVYSDTFRIDSSIFTIKDTINGEILGRSFKANIKEKTILVKEVTQLADKNAIYIGGNVRFNSIGAGIQYKKGNQLIGLSINSDKSIQLSYHIKLF